MCVTISRQTIYKLNCFNISPFNQPNMSKTELINKLIDELIANGLPVTAANISNQSLFQSGGTIDANESEVLEALSTHPAACLTLTDGTVFNYAELANMREWVEDCKWANMEAGQSEEMSHADLLIGVTNSLGSFAEVVRVFK